MDIKTVIIGVLALALAGVGGWAVSQKDSVSEDTNVAGSDAVVNSNYLNVGGVVTYFFRDDELTAATTTPLAIQAPSATSTLMLGSGCYFSTSSTSAKAVRFAKATSPNATTTFLFGANVAANAKADISATTTTDNFVFAPNTWLVMSMVGGSGVDSPAGLCHARFVVL